MQTGENIMLSHEMKIAWHDPFNWFCTWYCRGDSLKFPSFVEKLYSVMTVLSVFAYFLKGNSALAKKTLRCVTYDSFLKCYMFSKRPHDTVAYFFKFTNIWLDVTELFF